MNTPAHNASPAVSVVIPTRNAGPHCERLLQAVFGQATNKSFEVIALDSGSTDGTFDLLQQYGVRVISMPTAEFDWGRARETLFQAASAPIIANVSQDAIPAHEHWLDHLVQPLEDKTVGASSGSSMPDPNRHYPQFQWEKNGYYYFTRGIREFVKRYGRGLSFANAAVSRAVWERLHIDPQPTGEDFQFKKKLHAAGLSIAFPEDAPVLHHHNYALRALYRRCRNEGLALRELGCPYHEGDLLCDLASPAKYVQWLREVKRGSLRNAGEWIYPVLRPVAVYAGSRFARSYVWY